MPPYPLQKPMSPQLVLWIRRAVPLTCYLPSVLMMVPAGSLLVCLPSYVACIRQEDRMGQTDSPDWTMIVLNNPVMVRPASCMSAERHRDFCLFLSTSTLVAATTFCPAATPRHSYLPASTSLTHGICSLAQVSPKPSGLF